MHVEAAPGAAANLKTLGIAIQPEQTPSGCLQAQARLQVFALDQAGAGAIIGHAQMEVPAIVGSADADFSRLCGLGNPVPYCVLHQRLQQEVRDLGIKSIWSNLQNHVQPVLKSDFFDLQVTVHKLKLAAEGGDLESAVFQTHAQEFTKARHHSVRRANVGQHQR